MTNYRSVSIHENRPQLITEVADHFVDVLSGILLEKPSANIVLTGGTVGTDILSAIGEPHRRTKLDWSRMHLWWGDERWCPAGDPERNDTQAEAGFLARLDCPADNIHRFPAAGGGESLDDASITYERELKQHAPAGGTLPGFDLVFLGMGPDGHIASLFPGQEGVREKDRTVIPVRQSPKPPQERLSLTLPAINSAQRIWLCLSGREKGPALSLALAGASTSEVPAAGVEGRVETVFFVDREAIAEVSSELLD